MTGVNAKVEVEFTAGTWTDVTAYWDAQHPVTMTVGRTDANDRVQPGRLSGLVLNNSDGRFTAGNSSGAYWPNVTTGKKIRVSVPLPGLDDPWVLGSDLLGTGTVLGEWYPRFTGRVDSWQLSWADNGNTCTVLVGATDLLNDWSKLSLPENLMGELSAQIPGLKAYWPCASLNHSGASPTTSGGEAMIVGQSAPADLSAEPLPNESRRGPLFTTAAGQYGWMGRAPAIGTAVWSLSFWIKVTEPVPTGGMLPVIVGDESNTRVALRLYPDSINLCTITSGGTMTDSDDLVVTAGHLYDGDWHQIVLTFGPYSSPTATAKIIVDDGGTAFTGTNITPANTLQSATGTRYVQIGFESGVAVSHVGVWDSQSASLTSGAYYWDYYNSLRRIGWGLTRVNIDGLEDLVADRLDQISTITGMPTITKVGTNRIGLAPSPASGANALDQIRVVEDTDGGVFWVAPDGTPTYTRGSSRTSAPTLALSFTAADVGPVTMDMDRTQFCNEATVTNVGRSLSYLAPGASWFRFAFPAEESVTVRDSTSIAAAGRRTRSLTIRANGWNGNAYPLSGYIATRAGELLSTSEAPRLSVLPVDLLTSPTATQTAAITADIWDLVSITDLPTTGGVDSSWLGRIEGWTETLGVAEWSMTISTSFAGSRVGDSTFAKVGSLRLG